MGSWTDIVMAIRAPSEPEPWTNADVLSYEVQTLSVTEIMSHFEEPHRADNIQHKMVQMLAREASQGNWLLGEPTLSAQQWKNVGLGYTRFTLVAPAVKNVRPEHVAMVESSLTMTPSRRTINAIQETWPRPVSYLAREERPRYYEI